MKSRISFIGSGEGVATDQGRGLAHGIFPRHGKHFGGFSTPWKIVFYRTDFYPAELSTCYNAKIDNFIYKRSSFVVFIVLL